jgi:uroporphyrin-III C-methyltransferase
MDNLPIELPVLEPGWVWLAGAGPGDPGLLTLHAVNGLKQADAVVYDALVDKRVLELARNDAEMIYAGKRGGTPSPKQRDISLRLIDLAKQGKRVLRLKGGDPFVFGRGGEEALALVRAGIPFRVIPGISAGVGALAYAGIPLTHRSTNSAVTFVTGHDAKGGVPASLDWEALAKGSPFLVIFMALNRLGDISECLIKAGRPADEPVAVISKATMQDQTILESTLGDVVTSAARETIEPPAMLVVGENVRLRAGLDWLGALEGKALISDPLGEEQDSEAGD